MRKLKITIAGVALFLAVVIALLMILPREEYLVLSSILAVLFWITLAVAIMLVSLLISEARKRKRRTAKRKPPTASK